MTERLLMADVRTPDGETEAEPVTVAISPEALELVLDDGTTLVFDRLDFLAAAVRPPVAATPREAA